MDRAIAMKIELAKRPLPSSPSKEFRIRRREQQQPEVEREKFPILLTFIAGKGGQTARPKELRWGKKSHIYGDLRQSLSLYQQTNS